LTRIKLLIKIRKEKFHLLLSIILPMAIRSIPEFAFLYPIGFDTPLYFAMGKEWARHPLPFPLFVSLLGALYSLGIDLVVAMKFIPTLVYGFLGVASFLFAKNYLTWETLNSLLASLTLSLSIAMLRMSWDMHKLTLGVALMLLSLSFWRGLRDIREKLLFSVLSILTMFSHELITVTYLLTLVLFVLRKDENRVLALTIFLIGATCFLGAWYGSRLEIVFGWISTIFKSASFSSFTHELYTNGILIMKLYLPMLPILMIGLFRDDAVNVWTAFYLLGSLSTIISSSFILGGVLPWRYILLLIIPFSIYVARGATILSKRIRIGRRSLWALIVILIVNFPSYSFLTSLGSPIFYEYEGIMPEHMVQTSIPLWDIEPALKLLKNVNEGVLIVYGDFIGWAKYLSNAKVVTFGGTYQQAQTLEDAMRLLDGEKNIYLLYWDDSVAAKLGFKVIATNGNLRLYKYGGSAA